MTNFPGETFVSQGIKYILQYGPKGNLRPFVVGPVVVAAKTRNPWIILGVAALAVVFVGGILLISFFEEKHDG